MDCGLEWESEEGMVVYEGVYGEEGYWVRGEKMLLGKVRREGRSFNGLREIEK